MIAFPRTLAEAAAARGEIRAGGSDVMARYRSGVSSGPVVDLRDLEGLDRMEWIDGALRLGCKVKMAEIAAAEQVARAYPALAKATADAATPQIRNVATLGGNLLQRVRCWYYRNPAVRCYKRGVECCPARTGNNLYSVCIDLGPCVSPHPSTMGLALLAYDAEVEVFGGADRSIAELYGDGSDPARDNTLEEGEVLTAVRLPVPLAGERAAYHRTISRARASWPLIDAVVRLGLDGAGAIDFARVTLGGAANIPLRLPRVEQALVGGVPTEELLARAAELAAEGASPLPMTRYKVQLTSGTVLSALETALGISTASGGGG